MKNEMHLDILVLVVSHNALEVIIFIAKVAHYCEIGHGPEGPFEPQVTYLHVQVYFLSYYAVFHV